MTPQELVEKLRSLAAEYTEAKPDPDPKDEIAKFEAALWQGIGNGFYRAADMVEEELS